MAAPGRWSVTVTCTGHAYRPGTGATWGFGVAHPATKSCEPTSRVTEQVVRPDVFNELIIESRSYGRRSFNVSHESNGLNGKVDPIDPLAAEKRPHILESR